MTTAQDQQSRALSNLRHLYSQMAGGLVKDSAQAKRIAEGLLSPAIQNIEQAARALPAGMEPVAEVLSSRAGNDTSTIDKAFPAGTRLYTAARVQAMGRVPPGFVAVPMEPTAEMVDAAEEAYMPFGDMALAIQSAIAATRPPEA